MSCNQGINWMLQEPRGRAVLTDCQRQPVGVSEEHLSAAGPPSLINEVHPTGLFLCMSLSFLSTLKLIWLKNTS